MFLCYGASPSPSSERCELGLGSGALALGFRPFSQGLIKVLALGADPGAEHPFPPRTECQAAAETETIASSCRGSGGGEGGKAFSFMLYSHCGLL